MTLVLGKRCSDGVLLVADCSKTVTETEKGAVISETYSADGLKAMDGFRNGTPFAIVFGGYAGNAKGDSMISALVNASKGSDDNFVEALGRAAMEVMHNDLVTTDWNNDAMGRRTLMNERTYILIALGDQNFCVATAECDKFSIQGQENGFMFAAFPTSNSAKRGELEALRVNGPQTLSEAAVTAGIIFSRTAELCPNSCKYPGTVFFTGIPFVVR